MSEFTPLYDGKYEFIIKMREFGAMDEKQSTGEVRREVLLISLRLPRVNLYILVGRSATYLYGSFYVFLYERVSLLSFKIEIEGNIWSKQEK